MKKIILFLLIIATGYNVQSQILNLNEQIQQQNQWCWAAVSKSILDYYGDTLPQCKIADTARQLITWYNFGDSNCCENPYYGCNYWNYNYGATGSIQDLLKRLGGIQNYGTAKSLSISEITTQLEGNKPFVIRWGWDNGGGHFVTGYGLNNGMLYYMDPWYGEGEKVGTLDWVTKGGGHTWTHTNILTTIPETKVLDNKNNLPAISLYPNPSKGKVFVKLGSRFPVSAILNVVDQQGREVYSVKAGQLSNGMALDFAFENGLYFIQLVHGNYKKVEVLVVE
jgi:hypothetical protein